MDNRLDRELEQLKYNCKEEKLFTDEEEKDEIFDFGTY